MTAVALAGGLLSNWPDRQLVQERQLTSNSAENPVTASAISPDAKYVAYADAAGLHVHVLSTAETHTIPGLAARHIDRLVWYSDSTRLLLSGTDDLGSGVWAVSIMGGESIMQRNASQAAISGDGRSIAFVDPPGQHLLTVPESGGSPQTVFSAARGEFIRSPQWLPCERLAYATVGSRPKSGNVISPEITIRTQALLSGPSQPVLISDRMTAGAVLPDGRLVYGLGPGLSRRGECSLEMARANGWAAKPTKLASWTGDITISEISASADAAHVAVIKSTPQFDVYVADLDSPGTLRNTRRLTLDDRNDQLGAWSPDGKTVYFFSDRNGSYGVFRQKLDEPAAESLVDTSYDEIGPAAVGPAEAWFVYAVFPRNWATTTFRPLRWWTRTANGKPPIDLFGRSGWIGIRCAPAASSCIWSEHIGKEFVFSQLDPLHGTGPEIARLLLQAQVYYGWDLSPDGKRIAISLPHQGIRVLDIGSKQPSDIHIRGRVPDDYGGVSWAANGRGWYVSSATAAGSELLYVSPDGEPHVLVHQSARASISAMPSPDGLHLGFTTSTDVRNVWLIGKF